MTIGVDRRFEHDRTSPTTQPGTVQIRFFLCRERAASDSEKPGHPIRFDTQNCHGFCSGISRTGGACGAVSGAIMGINLVAGRNSPAESIEPSYTLTQKLIGRFEKQYGSTNCRQLIGCDLASEEGQQYFLNNHLMERCMQYAVDATFIAVSLIAELNSSRTTLNGSDLGIVRRRRAQSPSRN